jgi:hypothetical protein
VYNSTTSQWTNQTSSGTPWNVLITVTSDGATDVAPAIRAVLDTLGSNTHSMECVVQGSTKTGLIYLNSQVRTTTSHTSVKFKNPILIGPLGDPDGYGCLSILGSTVGTTTVTSVSSAARGSARVVVASVTNLAPGRLIRFVDNDTSGRSEIGWKSEMAEVVDVDASTLTISLDHPLHQTFVGTITVEIINAVNQSGFQDVWATFSGQQAAADLWPAKMQWVRNCFYRDCHFRGSRTNSWSRECMNVKWSYRSTYDDCSASFGWNFNVNTEYDYGFTADGATECLYTRCWVSNVRHAYTSDKGSCGLKYETCWSDNTIASGFDVHGSFTRDIRYTNCTADSAITFSALDHTRGGFLVGNTTYFAGVQNIEFIGCTARNFRPYTAGDGQASDGYGFGVHDGASMVTFKDCTVVDSSQGFVILSEEGLAPITDVVIQNCTMSNITANPVHVNAGIAPGDVNGVIIQGCQFLNGNAMSPVLVTGTSANTLSRITIKGNVWSGSTLAAGEYTIECRYVDDLIVEQNSFQGTRRGVLLQGCKIAAVNDNLFYKLVNSFDASNTINDAGGNDGFTFLDNRIVGYFPSTWSVPINSTGAIVEFVPAQRAYATSARPPATVVRPGGQIFNTTTGKPEWSNGTVWKDAAGVTVP